jgi:hypothetical protein
MKDTSSKRFRRPRTLRSLIPRVLEVMHRQVDIMLGENGAEGDDGPKDSQTQASAAGNPRARRRR